MPRFRADARDHGLQSGALVRHSSLLFVAAAACCAVALVLSPLACSSDDGPANASGTDASATDAAPDAGADADAADGALPCPDGGQLVYGGEYCELVAESVVTASTTKLELRTADTRPDAGAEQVFDGGDGGEDCTGVFADLTFDVVGQTASSSSCSATAGGYVFASQTLSLSSAQTAAMLAAWTEIRKVSVYDQPTSCGGTLAEYPALVTVSDSSGTETLDTCGYAPFYVYDDFKAFNDIVAFFQGDGGN